jgi:D-3-phosphoglycerate dehydrogenase / 2-oxoglutarate reductase
MSIGVGRTVLVGPVRYAELCGDGRGLLLESGFGLVENPEPVPYTQAELPDLVRDAHAVVAGVEIYDEDVLAAAPRLKVIARLGVGLDNIDLDACRRRGITVANVPGGNANAVAELALALMLSVLRRIPVMDARIRRGGWDRFTGRELTGKTVGLIGFGATSRELARRLRGFDVKLLVTDPALDAAAAAELGALAASLPDLLAMSDVVSLHAPHTPATHHLADAAFFRAMKEGAVFVNTSRGGLVDEVALEEALRTGEIAGAGLDVWEVEPVPATNPLLRLDTLVATTHGAADTVEAYRTVGLSTARAIVDVFSGRRPRHQRN